MIAAAPPPVGALIASMQADCARVETQRAEPPPRTLRARLERLETFDQAGREAYSQLASAVVTGPNRQAYDKAFACMYAKELADQAELKSMLPPTGWFTREAYGAKAALGAWLVVDHAVGDPGLMRTVLARLEPLATRGGSDGRAYAIMYDRVTLTFDHRPQRYGTQVECRGGVHRPMTLERPEQIDLRRKAIGFKETEAEYLTTYADIPCT